MARDKNDKKGNTTWKCKCDCGKICTVRSYLLSSGNTKSCGCLKKDKKPRYVHGKTDTRLYRIWSKMKNRCNCKTFDAYKNYGGRGISICNDWQSFVGFYNWAINNGYEDYLTLDRIDTNGNYEPNNCRWADWETQQNNRTNNVRFELNGNKYTVPQLARMYNINQGTLRTRLCQLKWDIKRALNIK